MREQEKTRTQPGRPREFDKDEVLAEIMKLFWENGYEATGLSHIMQATGLRKASLYAAYGNKHTMYLLALQHYENTNVNAAVRTLVSPAQPPKARISTFLQLPIDAVAHGNDRRGCFLCNASADRGSLDPETASLVQRGYTKMRRAIEDDLLETDPSCDTDIIKAKARLVLSVYTGLRVMARSGTPVSDLEFAKGACLASL